MGMVKLYRAHTYIYSIPFLKFSAEWFGFSPLY